MRMPCTAIVSISGMIVELQIISSAANSRIGQNDRDSGQQPARTPAPPRRAKIRYRRCVPPRSAAMATVGVTSSAQKERRRDDDADLAG